MLDAALTEARKGARPGALEVRTGVFSIYPRYATRPGGGNALSGWQGRAELVIEGRDTAAISALAGQLSGLTVARVGFSLSREAREKVEAEVGVMAIDRFKLRAASYALQFGFSGYRLREATVGGSDAVRPAPTYSAAATPAIGGAAEVQPVEPGRTTVRVNVSGSIELLAR